MHTITIKTGEGWRKVMTYSKVAQLMISREPDWDYDRRYNITHIVSGLSVSRFHTLKQARGALKAMLPLTDWKQTACQLQNDAILLGQIQKAIEPFEGLVGVR